MPSGALHYRKARFAGELRHDEREVDVRDAWSLAAAPELEDFGFTLTEAPTAIDDFADPAEVERVYPGDMAARVERLTGASRAVLFHMQVRDNRPDAAIDARRPAATVHVDYTEATFRIRAHEAMGDEAQQWLSRRFVAYNVWRGIAPGGGSAACAVRCAHRQCRGLPTGDSA